MIKEFQREYRWLSNFWFVDIELDGRIYPSVEHAYASAKCDEEWWKKLCSMRENPPGTIKRKGKTIKIKDNWEDIKLSIMEDCVRKKFSQEPYKTKLLNTGNEFIQEGNMWYDTFWGVDLRTNKGENNLGKIIMRIRSELKCI